MTARLLCLLLGYFCGSVQSGYLIGRLKGIDIRNYGSHSTGATNSLRVMGPAAGAAVLAGDILKALIPCFAVRWLFRDQPDVQYLMVLWTAVGVILGHDYPFYLGFRGGKGVASTIGVFAAVSVPAGLMWGAVFLTVVFITKYVSLSSICAMTFLAVFIILCFFRGALPVSGDHALEYMILALVIPLLSIWRHRSNVGRLMRGEESRLDLFTKGMKTGRK